VISKTKFHERAKFSQLLSNQISEKILEIEKRKKIISKQLKKILQDYQSSNGKCIKKFRSFDKKIKRCENILSNALSKINSQKNQQSENIKNLALRLKSLKSQIPPEKSTEEQSTQCEIPKNIDQVQILSLFKSKLNCLNKLISSSLQKAIENKNSKTQNSLDNIYLRFDKRVELQIAKLNEMEIRLQQNLAESRFKNQAWFQNQQNEFKTRFKTRIDHFEQSTNQLKFFIAQKDNSLENVKKENSDLAKKIEEKEMEIERSQVESTRLKQAIKCMRQDIELMNEEFEKSRKSSKIYEEERLKNLTEISELKENHQSQLDDLNFKIKNLQNQLQISENKTNSIVTNNELVVQQLNDYILELESKLDVNQTLDSKLNFVCFENEFSSKPNQVYELLITMKKSLDKAALQIYELSNNRDKILEFSNRNLYLLSKLKSINQVKT